MNALYIHHVLIAADDLERARQFYTGVLELLNSSVPTSSIRASGTRSATEGKNSTSMSGQTRRFAATSGSTVTTLVTADHSVSLVAFLGYS
jgi:predicted enzyme related to lactoylglutathione lyase